ncbi:hypothetical protein, conserved [Eimeria acervulina]|uniref:Uncharacterized protein n=1 Tax=Eimeria acervulina TaxID=5801 RepID=U6GAG3_EIMAC|nr:hypothetical protein, conserved [Eimeria acervulina]CDI77271.1 hypothetical protein, conserved [Eimeria acervulina]
MAAYSGGNPQQGPAYQGNMQQGGPQGGPQGAPGGPPGRAASGGAPMYPYGVQAPPPVYTGAQGAPSYAAAPYGAPQYPAAAYGAPQYPAAAYGGPYGGVPPPYPPAAPAAAGQCYTPQGPPMYGKPATTGAASMEVSSPPPNGNGLQISEDISVQIRHAFVRKVLGILAIQILFTFGIAAVFGFVPTLRNFLLQNYWLAIVAAVCALVLQLVLVLGDVLVCSGALPDDIRHPLYYIFYKWLEASIGATSIRLMIIFLLL